MTLQELCKEYPNTIQVDGDIQELITKFRNFVKSCPQYGNSPTAKLNKFVTELQGIALQNRKFQRNYRLTLKYDIRERDNHLYINASDELNDVGVELVACPSLKNCFVNVKAGLSLVTIDEELTYSFRNRKRKRR